MTTLQNTTQWMKLAGMKNLIPAHIEKAGEIDPNDATGPTQYVVLSVKVAEAVENGMPTSMPTLAEDILAQQATRIKQYKNDAYPLSEKQVGIILREVNRWMK